MDRVVIRDVVAIVAQRGREEWHEPYRADSQFLEVVELCFKPREITDAIPVAVVECADMNLIDDRVLVPKHIPVELQAASSSSQIRRPFAKQGVTQVYMKWRPKKRVIQPSSAGWILALISA